MKDFYLIIDTINHNIYTFDTKEKQSIFFNAFFTTAHILKDLCRITYYNNNKIISIRYK